MFAAVNSMGLLGIDGFPVRVEADISQGLPSFDVVGLPDAAVRESRDRVRAAMKNCGYTYPVSRITINMAPANVKKVGSLYDLPLLVAILKASGQLAADTDRFAFIGELSLLGEIRSVSGVLSMVIAAREQGFTAVFLPAENAAEGAVVEGITCYPVPTVTALVEHLLGLQPLKPASEWIGEVGPAPLPPDFEDVMGQGVARHVMEIAAVGGHNVLLIGSPGAGKSMLAKRLPGILPDMTAEEALEATKIHSVAGTLPGGIGLLRERPFRSPHHTVSVAGLTGGGTTPRPGEVSLAHHGVLFLDELPEFTRQSMESLRQPLEDSKVTISRVNATITYPCTFMLIAAMNPCPCGFFGHPSHPCTCSPQAVRRYLSRISGPLLDRIDLHIEVPPVQYEELASKKKAESSAVIRERVNKARAIQNERFAGTNITCNAHIPDSQLKKWCPVTAAGEQLLRDVFDKMGLSARAYNRILKVARTIADMDGAEQIDLPHIAEAVQYRSLDRKYWGE